MWELFLFRPDKQWRFRRGLEKSRLAMEAGGERAVLSVGLGCERGIGSRVWTGAH